MAAEEFVTSVADVVHRPSHRLARGYCAGTGEGALAEFAALPHHDQRVLQIHVVGGLDQPVIGEWIVESACTRRNAGGPPCVCPRTSTR